MTSVAKYNTFKGVSTALTVGTPIATLMCCGNMFVKRPDTAISATGIFAILFAVLLFKDKVAENFKVPSAFVLSTALFILLLLVENIIEPMKYVCIATMAASGVDELTFKRFYKNAELLLPKCANSFKYAGFVFSTTKHLTEVNNE